MLVELSWRNCYVFTVFILGLAILSPAFIFNIFLYRIFNKAFELRLVLFGFGFGNNWLGFCMFFLASGLSHLGSALVPLGLAVNILDFVSFFGPCLQRFGFEVGC